MNSPPTTAALTLSLTGPFERQGTEAAEGVRLWAELAGIRLTLVDDRGSKTAAARAYAAWLDSMDLLIGPYASGLVRAVAPLVRDAGRLLWNHGGSADDLAQPGVVSLPAPASSYFDGVVDEAVARQIDRLVVVQGTGPFAQAVADGATTRASERGLDVRAIEVSAVDAEDAAGAAFVLAGRFEHDVAVVRRLRRAGQTPALLGAVAAGIPAFAQELGAAAEGILGPVQWWPNDHTPEIGPSGTDFASLLPTPNQSRALLSGRPGSRCWLSRPRRPPTRPPGRGHAAVGNLDAARRLRPRCRLAPGRPSRHDRPLAGWPDGPAHHRLNPRPSTTTQLGQQPPIGESWQPYNRGGQRHGGYRGTGLTLRIVVSTARAIHPGARRATRHPSRSDHAGEALGRTFSTLLKADLRAAAFGGRPRPATGRLDGSAPPERDVARRRRPLPGPRAPRAPDRHRLVHRPTTRTALR